MTYSIGQTLGRYHILEQLGEGGMATVYKAFDTRLETDVALKVIRTDMLQPSMAEQTLKRFEREAKALAKLTHPNIVPILDYGQYENQPYIVMKYLPGGTLRQRLQAERYEWREAVSLLLPVARALAYAHTEGIIHRDIKPSNILITRSGEPMLTDFGVAKLFDSEEPDNLTGTGIGVGTPEYMAPEQFQGNVTPQVDVYAFGVVLYEMITGRRPFSAETPAAIIIKQATEPLPRPSLYVPGLPDGVEKVLLKAMAKEPGNRYASMTEFADAMEKLASTAQVVQPGQEETRFSAAPSMPVAKRTVNSTTGPIKVNTGKSNRNSVNWKVIGGVLALLMLVCVLGTALVALGGGLLAMSNPGNDPALSLTETSTATQVPVVVEPATDTPAQPTATPDQPVIPLVNPGGDILLEDDFSDIESGFPQDRSDGGVADYEDGGYRIFVNIDNTYYWGHPDKLMEMDVKVEVDAKVIGGPENNEFGVICRHLTNEEYYYFTVSSQGYAIIGKLNADGYTVLAEGQTNGIVNPGNETNHLMAICKGSDLAFYVNGKQALTTTDSEIVKGDVGLIAGTYDEPNVDVMFDNLLVTTP